MILGYTSKRHGKAVGIKESTYRYAGDTLPPTTQLWKILEFMLEDQNAFRCAWNLAEFVAPIFELLPGDNQEDIARDARTVYINGRQHFRLFYVPRKMLGITMGRYDVEVYDLEHFLGSDYSASTAKETAQAGEWLLDALERMGMKPGRLVSPVQVFQDAMLAHMQIPTIYTLDDDGLDASELAHECLNREWRRNYRPAHSLYGLWRYDMTAAYPSIARHMRDTDRATFTHSRNGVPPGCDWGFLRGTLTLKGGRINPFMLTVDDEPVYPTRGTWPHQTMTMDEVAFLYRHQLGEFKMSEGWFLKFDTTGTPLEHAFTRLHEHRSHSDLRSSLAKSMSVGMIGKFAEQHDDGSYGNYFHPIYHSTILARVRLAVASFIYRNHLDKHVASVLVDGIMASKDIKVKSTGEMGSWRKAPPIG